MQDSILLFQTKEAKLRIQIRAKTMFFNAILVISTPKTTFLSQISNYPPGERIDGIFCFRQKPTSATLLLLLKIPTQPIVLKLSFFQKSDQEKASFLISEGQIKLQVSNLMPLFRKHLERVFKRIPESVQNDFLLQIANTV